MVFEETRTWVWEQQQAERSFPKKSFTIFNAYSNEERKDTQDEEPTTPRVDSTESMVNEYTDTTMPLQTLTPQTDVGESNSQSVTSNFSSEPENFRLLSDVYDEKDVVELEEELLLLGVDEPSSYNQAVTEEAWQMAMKNETDAIEKNKT